MLERLNQELKRRTHVIRIFPDEQSALRLIRRLPVLARDKRLVGIVSLRDLAIKDDENHAAATLERVSEPSRWAFLPQ
jgi:CBS-domain-containing membrane protein